MKRNKIITFCFLLILFAPFFYTKGADAQKPAVAPAMVTVQQAQNLSNLQDTYSYNPAGKPDPFKPLVEPKINRPVPVKMSQEEIHVKPEASIFPLQKADADTFNLVGIIGDQTGRIAIVEDAKKRFYPLFVGTQIGLQRGKVTAILGDQVIIEEPAGKKAKRIVLKLRIN